jgi:cell wall-associated NlpC family hydrolase
MYDKRMVPRVLACAAVAALCAAPATRALAAGKSPSAPDSLSAAARATATQAASKVWHGTQDVALFALGLLGVDYRFGGSTPDRGLDCSGLVQYVFQEVTGTTLPRTSREMSRLGTRVAIADLAPGDLVFFNTRRFAFSHVGLYLGDNRFIHAPSAGGEVEIAALSQSYWKRRFDGARRLVGVVPSLVPSVIGTAVAAPAAAPASAPSAEAPSPADEPAGP